jgi:long-chain acyl-CoA synthetase
MRAGGAVVPIDPRRGGSYAVWVAEASRPVVSCVTPEIARAFSAAGLTTRGKVVEARSLDAAPRMLRALGRLARPRRALAQPPPGCTRWSRWLARRAAPHVPTVSPTDEALVQVVDGTSGDVVFHHGELTAGAHQLTAWLTDVIPGAETWLLLAEMWSPAGFAAGLGAAFLQRARLALLARPNGEDTLDALRYLRPTTVISSSGHMSTLLGVPHLLGADLRSVRAWLVLDPMAGDLGRQFEEVCGLEPCQGLALPRAAGLVACNPLNAPRAAGSVGLPMPSVDVRIARSDGSDAAAGEVGWLWLRGPNIPPAGNWWATRVAATSDKAGFLYLAGDTPLGRP